MAGSCSFTVLLIVIGRLTNATPCAKRIYASLFGTRFACVCNATYCDEYADVQPTTTTSIIYSSSENGDRMSARSTPVSFTKLKSGLFTARIKMNPAVTYQEIIGFGGAFADAAGNWRKWVSKDNLSQEKKNFSQCAYSREVDANIVWKKGYSYDDYPGDVRMSHFALAEADLKYKISYITRALSLTSGDLRLFSSPWAAPAWMKRTGRMQGWGRLRKGMKATWAKYFVRFFEEYAARGISFWATTVQNEPSTGAIPYWPWQTMYWSARGERSFVTQHLGPALRASNASKNVKIIGLDDQRMFLPLWAYKIYSDPIASSYFAGMGLHWYLDPLAPAVTMSMVHAAYPDKFILYTEACACFIPFFKGPQLGDWSRAEDYVRSIIKSLNNYVAGFTDWNNALNLDGGSSWVPNYVDSPIIVNAAADEFLKQPMHYAMAHFSRFLRPGAKRVQSSISGIDSLGTMHTAFVGPDGQRIVTILNIIPIEKEIIIEEANVIWKRQ